MFDASGYTSENRYPALRVISIIFKVLAVLAIVFGLLGALFGLVQMTGNTYGAFASGGLLALASLLYGGLLAIYMFAASEVIRSVH